jgi:hypothetical protein
MSEELIKSQLELLKVIARPDSKYRRAILVNADRDLVHAICIIIKNVLSGAVKISDSDKEKLRKFKNTLHLLIKKSSLKNKKKILIQKGKF